MKTKDEILALMSEALGQPLDEEMKKYVSLAMDLYKEQHQYKQADEELRELALSMNDTLTDIGAALKRMESKMDALPNTIKDQL